jgi:hypothetical protein
MNPSTIRQVRQLLSRHIGSEQRQSARQARATYISELLAATMRGDDTEREAQDWLRRLTELCEAHATVEDIARWYANEQERLRRLLP